MPSTPGANQPQAGGKAKAAGSSSDPMPSTPGANQPQAGGKAAAKGKGQAKGKDKGKSNGKGPHVVPVLNYSSEEAARFLRL